ncbi:reticulon-like protein B15 [Brassica napus]|nr:reticulon-like protein B15 [Brassica napus]XP_048604231.1 reticulon-like protein B15 [Brassica napus]
MSLVDQLLGEGAVADLCVWKNKIKSGITFAIATHSWYQLVIMETRLVPFLCSILLVLMLLLFIWVKFGEPLFIWRAPTPEEFKQKDSPVRALFSEIEGLLLMLYEIAYEEDMKTLLWAILFVAIIYTLGSYISLLTIIYICLVCLMTIPVLYLLCQEVVDNFIEDVSEVKNKIHEIFKPSRRSCARSCECAVY